MLFVALMIAIVVFTLPMPICAYLAFKSVRDGKHNLSAAIKLSRHYARWEAVGFFVRSISWAAMALLLYRFSGWLPITLSFMALGLTMLLIWDFCSGLDKLRQARS